MSTYSQVYGIDVSKSTLDLHLLNGSSKESFQRLENFDASIKSWITTIDRPEQTLCVLEATGAYSQKIIYYLGQAGIALCQVSPLQSHGYTQALGVVSKHDRQAARTLAQMGVNLKLPIYRQPDENMQRRKQILGAIQALSKQSQQLRNQLHALEHQVIFAPEVVSALETSLQVVTQQVKQLESQMDQVSDQEYERQYNLLLSIVGIGPKSAQHLLSATGGLHHFERPAQLSKFVGLVPFSHQSGSSVRKQGRMTKRGNSDLRSCLYMAARSARQHNLACKDLYDRLRAKGKPHKQAMVAVMNKLIKQAHAVVTSGVPFDNQYFEKFLAK